MAAPVSADELIDLVRKSGVADENRLSARLAKLHADGDFPDDPVKLADALVSSSILTQFQADHMLEGRYRGFSIGKYKMLARIGSGGMGQVYLCEHPLMRRRVAVKVLPPARAADESSRERFYREARAVATLDHPNIVHAYDIDQDDKFLFLVMEYVEGADLQAIVHKSGPLDLTRACHYIRQAALGLEHARQQGLVHRDIKPGNILIDRSGVAKILDMGLARFFNDNEDNLTKDFDENVLGTTDYLAPEQALDSHGVDCRADVYSLGATFYFLLTGRTPFGEGSVAQKLLWHTHRTPRPIADLRQGVPADLEAIIFKMMAKQPADRYQTPGALADALTPFTQTPIPPPEETEMPAPSPAPSGIASSPPLTPALSGASSFHPTASAVPLSFSPHAGGGFAPAPSLSAAAAQATPVAVLPAPTPLTAGPKRVETVARGTPAADTADPSSKADTGHASGRTLSEQSQNGSSHNGSSLNGPSVNGAVRTERPPSPVFSFRCACGHAFKVKVKFVGLKAKCPACKQSLRVPTVAEAALQLKSVEKSRSPAPAAQETAEGLAIRRMRASNATLAAPEERQLREHKELEEDRGERQPRGRAGDDSGSQKKGTRRTRKKEARILNKTLWICAGVAGAVVLFATVVISSLTAPRVTNAAVVSNFTNLRSKKDPDQAALASTLTKPQVAGVRIALRNNMLQLCGALLAMNDANGQLPSPGYSQDSGKPNTKAFLSWRVAVLPFIDETKLFNEFKLDEPWNSAHNITLLPKMPGIFRPVGAQKRKEGFTYLQMVTGPGTLFPTPTTKAVIPNSIPDGLSNTVLIVEANESVPWTKPVDVFVDVTNVTHGVVPKMGAGVPEGFYVGLADGNVRFLEHGQVSDRTMRQAFNPKDGNAMGPDWNPRN